MADPTSLRLGISSDAGLVRGPLQRRRALAERAWDAGIRHVFCADHVSFHTGWGQDGLTQAALLASLHPDLEVHLGVYLLALRHPVVVARQMITINEAAPGRLVLGVGVGGEDPHEFEVCGVDPRTRGARTDEALSVLRPLLAGQPVTHHGRHFQFDDALLVPAAEPAMPILVGGRAPAALRRAGRHGDGWLGIWSTPERYRDTLATVQAHAVDAGRGDTAWQHGLQLWAAVDDDSAKARERLAARMQRMYRIPFEKFERYSPYGSASAVADALQPYIAAGAGILNLMLVGDSAEQVLDDTAAVIEQLKSR